MGNGDALKAAKSGFRCLLTLSILLILTLLTLPAVVKAADGKPALSWFEKIKISGDFKYRHELITEELGSGATKWRVPDRNRHRMRIRLGFQAQANDDMDIIARFATAATNNGFGEPLSTVQDIGGGFGSKPFWVERAYVDYHPFKQLTARAGKFPVPFDGTELVWDPDLNLEGVAALPSISLKNMDLYMGVGGFWVAERKSADGPDQDIFVGQLGTTPYWGKLSGLFAVSYIDYGNVKNSPTLLTTSKGLGNSVRTVGTNTYYINDYNLVDVNAQLTLKGSRVEGTVLGDYVINTAADKDTANSGWLAGLNVKVKKLPLDWEVGYSYRVLKADATIGALSDNDPAGGGTNFNGHKVYLYLSILPNAKLGIIDHLDTRDPDHAKQNYSRFAVDLDVKF